ncbi:hypothetical protein [Salinarimonas rosea]|uniref:hypothetical protein n=1 Tax=Salinarimonas rosea TaxID=552063 RepID=UPI00048AAA1C|nr:hypothetical protein [Salinarimonas rosea]
MTNHDAHRLADLGSWCQAHAAWLDPLMRPPAQDQPARIVVPVDDLARFLDGLARLGPELHEIAARIEAAGAARPRLRVVGGKAVRDEPVRM